MNELTKQDRAVAVRDAEAVAVDRPQSLSEVLAIAALDSRVDAAKMTALFDLKCRIDARDAEVEFEAAKARMYSQVPRITQHGTIPGKNGTIKGKFARYEDIDLILRPLISEEGFSLEFDSEQEGDHRIKVIAWLCHRLGHKKPYSVLVPIEKSGLRNEMQEVGSAVAYGKRYLVKMIFNLIEVGENDGPPKDVRPISDDQALTIQTLMADAKVTGVAAGKFWDWTDKRWGVRDVKLLPTFAYPDVVKVLQDKAANR